MSVDRLVEEARANFLANNPEFAARSSEQLTADLYTEMGN